MLRIFLTLVLAAPLAEPCVARNLNGQYDNASPELRDWYQAQNVPGGQFKGQSCCSLADGAKAEAEIRLDAEGQPHYWARFEACGYDGYSTTPKCRQIDWMPVPDEAVLNNYKNPNGVPIVWWFDNGGKIVIRCFARETEV